MNKYEVKGSCMYSSVAMTENVSANSETEARGIALNRGVSIKSIKLVTSNIKASVITHTKNIVDAEELLYEMDMAGRDSVTRKEGFGEQTTYTREEVLSQIMLPRIPTE